MVARTCAVIAMCLIDEIVDVGLEIAGLFQIFHSLPILTAFMPRVRLKQPHLYPAKPSRRILGTEDDMNFGI
jgi:hypothetical protein